MTDQGSKNYGTVVTLAGTGINLALGILYTWSVLKSAIMKDWGWNAADTALPYSVACLVFAFSTILAGRLQDKLGPRWIATMGGVLVGIGCLVAGMMGDSLAGFVIGFGILAGTGIGFGYASATPPAVKWFPPSKTGLIAGIVVAGFGLASVIWAPLATAFIAAMGISKTMMTLGVIFLIVVVILSQLLRNPPAGYVAAAAPSASAQAAPAKAAVNMEWREMMKTSQFWLLWLMYFCGAGVGLMLIGTAQKFGKAALGETNAFWIVVVLALGNAGGRVLAGSMSDRIGRQWTMFIAYVLQAVMVIALIFVKTQAVFLMLIIAMAGANYGANLALFPAASKDYFGLKNFGLNYGVLFTSWGIGGFVLSYINGLVVDAYKVTDAVTGAVDDSLGLTYSLSFAAVIMIGAAILTFASRAVAKKSAA